MSSSSAPNQSPILPPVECSVAACAAEVAQHWHDCPVPIVAHTFQLLPLVEAVLAVSRLSKDWRAWSAGRAAALREAREAAQRSQPRADLLSSTEPPPPAWAVKESWPDLSGGQRTVAAVRAALHGDASTLLWMEANSELRWWHGNSCYGVAFKACEAAACGGHLALLQQLHSTKRPSVDLCAAAARGGHLHVLQWLQARRAHRGAAVCCAAAEYGQLAALQWLHANRWPWDERTCAAAAYGGHLSVLQFLHANACCPWNAGTCASAAGGGHLSVLQFLHAHGCPMDLGAFDHVTKALLEKDPGLHAWLKENDLLEQWSKNPSIDWDVDDATTFGSEEEEAASSSSSSVSSSFSDATSSPVKTAQVV